MLMCPGDDFKLYSPYQISNTIKDLTVIQNLIKDFNNTKILTCKNSVNLLF